MDPKNRFQGMNSASLCSLAGRYNKPIPTRFLAHIDCLKIPAQHRLHRLVELILGIYSWASLKIRALTCRATLRHFVQQMFPVLRSEIFNCK